MSVIEVREVRNIEEFEGAKFVSGSFYIDELGSDEKLIESSWNFQKSFDFNNVYIALENGKVIGVVRVVQTEMKLGKSILKTGCITSVVVEKHKRGSGVSRDLMDTVLSSLRERGFDLAYLFARRAVDDYYNKFGFYGVSSHEKVMNIKYVDRESTSKKISLVAGYNSSKHQIYDRFYKDSYGNCLGMVLRDENYWNYIGDRTSLSKDLDFSEIYLSDDLVGYTIKSREKILEIGIDSTIDKEMVSCIFKEINPTEIWIGKEHSLIRGSDFLDVEFSYRKCVNGGHMMCDLTNKSVCKEPNKGYDQLKESLLLKSKKENQMLGEILSLNFPWADQH